MRLTPFLVAVLLAAACSSAAPETTNAAPTTTTTSQSLPEPNSNVAEGDAVPEGDAVSGDDAVPEGEATTALPATTTTTTTTTTTEPPPELLGVELQVVAELDHVLAIDAPAADPRLFLAQRGGTVHIIGPEGELRAEPFLDITDRVRANGIEQGLLGLAFHPQYAENGRFFVYYTDANDDTQLSEFTVSGDADIADSASERELLLFDQPTERHNGGMLEFGPDGYLYVAVGDGGDGGHNGQKADTLFGAILRLDVDGGDPYAIPADNPFVDGSGAAEVWVYGLRNPWRFSIDNDHIYIADVGQQDWEEITVLPLSAGGANLGWAYREGSMCFNSPECEETETVLPTVEYPHADGCSVTGGYVYRGEAIPELRGVYFYSDWCRGWVRSFRYSDGEAVDLQDWPELDPGQVNTFGTDAFGELYFGIWGGDVLKLVPIRAEG